MAVKKTAKQDAKKSTATMVMKPAAVKKAEKPMAAAKKKTPAPQKPATASVAPAATALPTNDVTYIIIDYPTENETIAGVHYAIRIGASGNGTVELSINNGPWEPARYADGYWWYDWGYFVPGATKIAARLVDDKGKVIKNATTRKCVIG